MMMNFSRVTISTFTIDPQGFLALTLTNDTGLRDVGRRVTIVPTLDGSVSVDDGGSTPADRAFALQVRPRDRLEAEQIQYLTQAYPLLQLATREGCFQVVPLSATFSDVSCTWNLRIVAKLA